MSDIKKVFMFLWFRSWNLLHDGDECKEGAEKPWNY